MSPEYGNMCSQIFADWKSVQLIYGAEEFKKKAKQTNKVHFLVTALPVDLAALARWHQARAIMVNQMLPTSMAQRCEVAAIVSACPLVVALPRQERPLAYMNVRGSRQEPLNRYWIVG